MLTFQGGALLLLLLLFFDASFEVLLIKYRVLYLILSCGCSIQRSTTGWVPFDPRGVFDQKTRAIVAFYVRFWWKSKVYNAVFWVHIVRTCDIVNLGIEHPQEVSILEVFLITCHVTGYYNRSPLSVEFTPHYLGVFWNIQFLNI